MPINIYTVANHLAENGWQLLSQSYKNLDTELEMICPKGHKQVQTYREWRKHMLCEQCMGGDASKIKKNKVPIKTIDTQRILALDAATGVTGYAIYDNKVLVHYGTYKTNSALTTTARINQVKQWLAEAIDKWEPDFVGVEHIQLQAYGGNNQFQVETYRVLANLQGVILDTLFEKSIDSDLVRPSEWRKYCGISEGDSHRENKKAAAQAKVKLWYNQDCTQDEADAICIGKYFCGKLKNTVQWGEDIL